VKKYLQNISIIYNYNLVVAMWMRSLTEFIKKSQDKRQVKRAIAVKMLLSGYKHEAIIPILGVSSGLITKCKNALTFLRIFSQIKYESYSVFSRMI